MDKVITISRELGSGGHELGERLADLLGVPFYDKELITLASENTNIAEDIFEHYDEHVIDQAGLDIIEHRSFSEIYQIPMSDAIFVAQSNIIRRLALKGPCVIVGRCADRILNDSINIFVHANIKKRMERTLELEPGTEGGKALEERIKEVDKKRKEYYQYYTGSIWGRAQNYHLCLDSGEVGVDGCIRAVLAYMGEIELLKEFVEGRVGEDD